MNRIELSERLGKIAAHIRPEDTVADIGTDHGYLPIWLMQNRAAAGVIISDINEGPLEKAAQHIRRWQASDAPDLRLGAGLTVLEPGEATVLVIAGMGGILSSRILSDSPEVVQRAEMLLLQPRNHAFELRKYLRSLEGFTICSEEVAREGRKFSEIIAVKREDRLDAGDHSRIVRTGELESELGLEQRLYDEVPAMLLADLYTEPLEKGGDPGQSMDQIPINKQVSENSEEKFSQKRQLLLDYLQYKCLGEHIVIENITRNGKSDYADERLTRARNRLAAFEKMLQSAEMSGNRIAGKR